MDFSTFFSEAYTRLFIADKPAFFKKLQTIGMYLGIIGAIPLMAGQAGFDVSFLPKTAMQYMTFAGFLSAFIAQFTASAAAKMDNSIE